MTPSSQIRGAGDPTSAPEQYGGGLMAQMVSQMGHVSQTNAVPHGRPHNHPPDVPTTAHAANVTAGYPNGHNVSAANIQGHTFQQGSYSGVQAYNTMATQHSATTAPGGPISTHLVHHLPMPQFFSMPPLIPQTIPSHLQQNPSAIQELRTTIQLAEFIQQQYEKMFEGKLLGFQAASDLRNAQASRGGNGVPTAFGFLQSALRFRLPPLVPSFNKMRALVQLKLPLLSGVKKHLLKNGADSFISLDQHAPFERRKLGNSRHASVIMKSDVLDPLSNQLLRRARKRARSIINEHHVMGELIKRNSNASIKNMRDEEWAGRSSPALSREGTLSSSSDFDVSTDRGGADYVGILTADDNMFTKMLNRIEMKRIESLRWLNLATKDRHRAKHRTFMTNRRMNQFFMSVLLRLKAKFDQDRISVENFRVIMKNLMNTQTRNVMKGQRPKMTSQLMPEPIPYLIGYKPNSPTGGPIPTPLTKQALNEFHVSPYDFHPVQEPLQAAFLFAENVDTVMSRYEYIKNCNLGAMTPTQCYNIALENGEWESNLERVVQCEASGRLTEGEEESDLVLNAEEGTQDSDFTLHPEYNNDHSTKEDAEEGDRSDQWRYARSDGIVPQCIAIGDNEQKTYDSAIWLLRKCKIETLKNENGQINFNDAGGRLVSENPGQQKKSLDGKRTIHTARVELPGDVMMMVEDLAAFCQETFTDWNVRYNPSMCPFVAIDRWGGCSEFTGRCWNAHSLLDPVEKDVERDYPSVGVSSSPAKGSTPGDDRHYDGVDEDDGHEDDESGGRQAMYLKRLSAAKESPKSFIASYCSVNEFDMLRGLPPRPKRLRKKEIEAVKRAKASANFESDADTQSTPDYRARLRPSLHRYFWENGYLDRLITSHEDRVPLPRRPVTADTQVPSDDDTLPSSPPGSMASVIRRDSYPILDAKSLAMAKKLNINRKYPPSISSYQELTSLQYHAEYIKLQEKLIRPSAMKYANYLFKVEEAMRDSIDGKLSEPLINQPTLETTAGVAFSLGVTFMVGPKEVILRGGVNVPVESLEIAWKVLFPFLKKFAASQDSVQDSLNQIRQLNHVSIGMSPTTMRLMAQSNANKSKPLTSPYPRNYLSYPEPLAVPQINPK